MQLKTTHKTIIMWQSVSLFCLSWAQLRIHSHMFEHSFLASKYCKYLVVSSVMIWVGLKLSIIQPIGCHLPASPASLQKDSHPTSQPPIWPPCNMQLVVKWHLLEFLAMTISAAQELSAEQLQICFQCKSVSKFSWFFCLPNSFSGVLHIALWGLVVWV